MDSATEVLTNFIVLEGLDGSGTTTQMEILSKRLAEGGSRVMPTCEPSRGPVGVFIRSILRQEVDVDPCTLAHLFAADRNEHLYNASEGMVNHLESGGVVVCDRYILSSLAYQSIGCSYDLVATLNGRFPLPEYLIFLEVSPEECQKRRSTRPGVELFDASAIQNQIVQNYERGIAELTKGAAKEGIHLIRVDGEKSIEEVAENIWSELSTLPIQRM